MKSSNSQRGLPIVRVIKKAMTIEVLLWKHTDLFQNKLGCCKISKAKLYLRQDEKSIFRLKRQVPYAPIDRVDNELN